MQVNIAPPPCNGIYFIKYQSHSTVPFSFFSFVLAALAVSNTGVLHFSLDNYTAVLDTLCVAFVLQSYNNGDESTMLLRYQIAY